MSYRLKFVTFALALSVPALACSSASAQYYSPGSAIQSFPNQPIGLGINPGIGTRGINPNVGFGLGPIGTGVGAGFGTNGIGTGANIGVGPIGVSTDGGLNRNGLGTRVSAGVGNTGAGFEGGFSRGGLGVGTGAQLFGFGPSASVGIGNRGPGLGASLAFGPLGTLLIGSHRNSYPGAKLTSAYANPNRTSTFYQTQNYGANPYYRAVPSQAPHYRRVEQPVSSYISNVANPYYGAVPSQTLQYRQTEEPVSSYISSCGSSWVC